ncbi:MAG: DoxX family protein [Rhodospirillales bacterium]|nr:DoxX family protein [Rhodospirillales bacterium]MBN8905105.1 DoxX family protein [Rhodospirillales bacterium]
MAARKPFWFPLLGLGFAVAGADKLFGQSGYRRLFRHLGLSEQAMRVVGVGEFAGGVLVASLAGRRLGGLLLTMASTAVLTSELRKGADQLALPRAGLLAAAVLAAALPTSRPAARTVATRRR